MNWKNQPYWVRGGKIAVLFAFIFFILVLKFFPALYYLLFVFVSPILYLTQNLGSSWSLILALTIGLVIFYIIGAIIGKIYEKIKNRTSSPPSTL